MPRIAEHPVLTVPAGRNEVEFSFDGEPLKGFAGEPIASALMAAGVDRFSVHKRDGAPLGIFCANGQCSQCTVLVDGIPRKACVTPLAGGLDVRTLREADFPIVSERVIQCLCGDTSENQVGGEKE